MATQIAAPSRAGKYVTFQISRHYYAVEAGTVRLVAPGKDIVPVDHPLPFVCGAVVIRGRRVPVLDLRQRLGLSDQGDHPGSSVVLLATGDECGLPLIGIVADRMTEVIELRDRDFRKNVIQIRAAGRLYGRPKTLLSVARLLTGDELAQLKCIF